MAAAAPIEWEGEVFWMLSVSTCPRRTSRSPSLAARAASASTFEDVDADVADCFVGEAADVVAGEESALGALDDVTSEVELPSFSLSTNTKPSRSDSSGKMKGDEWLNEE